MKNLRTLFLIDTHKMQDSSRQMIIKKSNLSKILEKGIFKKLDFNLNTPSDA